MIEVEISIIGYSVWSDANTPTVEFQWEVFSWQSDAYGIGKTPWDAIGNFLSDYLGVRSG